MPLTLEEAQAQAREMVAIVRARGFKSGGRQFSDAQIWQAILDSRDMGGHYWDAAAVKLIEHVIEGRTAPTAEQYPA
jgi:hypothetical protein